MTVNFDQTFANAAVILAEGAVIERLRRDGGVEPDPHILHAGLVYQPAGKETLERIYREYLDVGRAYDLPMIVFAPTWRASPERLRAAGFPARQDVNGDGVRFLSGIRDSYGSYAKKVFVGGLMACRGDAYDSGEALSEQEAASFHKPQVDALARAGVDFLMAATLPAASEATGLARAMATVKLPYLLSFVVRPTGTLLDGTPLDEAVARIDSQVKPPPLGYMVNCVHPTVFAEVMDRMISRSAELGRRVIGLQANTSTRSPEELDDLDHLDAAGEPEAFAEGMLAVHRRFGTRILGGCCGTDARHIRCIAERITGSKVRKHSCGGAGLPEG